MDAKARLTTVAVTLTVSSGSVTPTVDVANIFIVSTGVNLTIANPSGTAVEGQLMLVRVKSSAGSLTLSFGANYRGSADLPLPSVLTATSGKTDYMIFRYNAVDSKWDYAGKNFGF